MPDPASPADPLPDEVLAVWLARALEGTDVAEEAHALSEVVGDLQALADAPAETLRPDVRAAALAAWTTSRVPGTAGAAVAARPPRAVRLPNPAAPTAPHLLRWAALLVAGLGVTLLALLSAPEEATAGLRLGTLFRLDQAGGRQETTSGRRIPWGERLTAAAREVLGFRLPDGSAVVLRDEGVVRLARAEDGSAVLALESGTVRVAVGGGGEVRLALGSCRLDVTQGRAWASAGDGLFALGPTGRGWLRVPGAEDRPLAGPLEGRCTASGAPALAPGAHDPERFRMPAVLAAGHLGRAPGRLVAARQWRVVGGRARRHGTSLQVGVPGARLAWRPAPDVRRARALRLRVEGGAGLTVSLEGGEGAAMRVDGHTDLALPAGWYERLAASGEELVLALTWTEPGARNARFLGASFLTDDEVRDAEAGDGPARTE